MDQKVKGLKGHGNATHRGTLKWHVEDDHGLVTEFQPKEPCLTPTLMDEGQARNPNTTYNGYKMEFWKFV